MEKVGLVCSRVLSWFFVKNFDSVNYLVSVDFVFVLFYFIFLIFIFISLVCVCVFCDRSFFR